MLNRAPEPATSLHVYSPPLSSMSWYDPPAPAALGREGPPAGSYPLHPAGRRARP